MSMVCTRNYLMNANLISAISTIKRQDNAIEQLENLIRMESDRANKAEHLLSKIIESYGNIILSEQALSSKDTPEYNVTFDGNGYVVFRSQS